jgi:hypothetical protein
MVSVLAPRIFAVANGDSSLCHTDIGPFDPADLGLAHGLRKIVEVQRDQIGKYSRLLKRPGASNWGAAVD